MENLKNQTDELLNTCIDKKDKFSEFTVSDSLRLITKDIQVDEIPTNIFSDILAFEFCEDYQGKSGGWKLYYGPKLTFKTETGETKEFPSLNQITPDIIELWKTRSNESLHPILLARYNSLVWEFTKIITGENPEYIFALNAIDNIILIPKKDCDLHSVNMFKKLEYALNLALQLNKPDRIKAVYETLIWFEDNVSEDDKPGLWGHLFELLLDNKKVNLPDSVSLEIIMKMEERLTRLSNDKTLAFNPWAVERASLLLANYYRKHRKDDDVKRVLLIFQEAFDRICTNASPIQVSSWQQNIYNYFKEYGLITEAEDIAVKLQKIGTEMLNDLKKISHKIEITNEEMDKYLMQFTNEGLTTAYIRIAVHFIPRKNDIETQLNDLFNSAPLSFLVNTQIIDHHGRSIATIGSYEDDRIGHIIQQMSQNLSMSAIFYKLC